tara:strand:- start:194 stop:616 length:423 start_codon:yes stop_codon:yes gene_type:complete
MSTLKANTFTGTTSAGSILVTGEGGSVTTNLQQGLAKCWAEIASGGGSNNDSFNVSSNDDDGTGDYGINFTNNMNSTDYSACGTITFSHTHNYNNVREVAINTKTASSVEIDTAYGNSSNIWLDYDIETDSNLTVHGDLA